MHRSGLLVDGLGGRADNGDRIVLQGQYYGVIDPEGKLIVPISYNDISFEDSYINFRRDEMEGLADSLGNLVVPLEYTAVRALTHQVVGIWNGEFWAIMDIQTRKRLTDYAYSNILYDPNPEQFN